MVLVPANNLFTDKSVSSFEYCQMHLYVLISLSFIPPLSIYDVQEKKIPVHIVKSHKKTLEEYLTKCRQIRSLQGQLNDSDASDIELDMNESRIAVDIMDLHDQIEVLKMSLEKMENPFLR